MLMWLSSRNVNTITWGHSNIQKSLRYNWSQNSKDSTVIFVFYREIKSLLFYFTKATLSRQRIRFIICHSHIKTLRVIPDSSTRAKLFQYVPPETGAEQ